MVTEIEKERESRREKRDIVRDKSEARRRRYTRMKREREIERRLKERQIKQHKTTLLEQVPVKQCRCNRVE